MSGDEDGMITKGHTSAVTIIVVTIFIDILEWS